MKHLEQNNLLHFQKEWIQVTGNTGRVDWTLVIQVRRYWGYGHECFSTHSLGVQARGYWGYGRGNTGNTGVTGVMGVNAWVHTAWEYRWGLWMNTGNTGCVHWSIHAHNPSNPCITCIPTSITPVTPGLYSQVVCTEAFTPITPIPPDLYYQCFLHCNPCIPCILTPITPVPPDLIYQCSAYPYLYSLSLISRQYCIQAIKVHYSYFHIIYP